MVTEKRRQRGYANWKAGADGENIVSMRYGNAGLHQLASRWRGTAGEIDLILHDGQQVVFVEVKRAANFDRAIASLGARQVARIVQTAEEYLESEPGGSLTDCRFDLAIVDDAGRTRVLENVLAA